MATEKQQALNIQNLDTYPTPIAATPSAGGPAIQRQTDGVCPFTTGATAGSTYQLARLKSSVKLKEVKIKLDAAVTTFTCNIGFYYSDSPTEMVGKLAALLGTAINATFLASATALAAQNTAWLDASASLPGADYDMPLWQALALSADPNCSFDLVLTNTATNSGASNVASRIAYVE